MKKHFFKLILENEKKIFIFFLLIFFLHLLFRIYTYKDNYLSRFDPVYWEQRYNESQWVIGNSKNPIGDDGLFSYAAWKYIHGENPISIVPEYPPLGKYILGISIILFQNQNIFAALTGFFVLFTFYVLNIELFKNKLIAFLPVFLFSIEPLFYEQLKAPYFDLLYLLFLLLTFLFFLKKNYFLSSFFLGCFASIKFPSLVVVVITAIIFYLLLSRNYLSLKKSLISIFLIFIVYIASYFRYFWLGNNIIDFLGFQKWIVNYYLIGAKGEIFSIFPLVVFGNWNTWWNGVIRVAEWNIFWPIIFLASLIYQAQIIIKRDFSSKFFFLGVWLALLFLFLSIIPVWPRYLLLAIPFMYNLTICALLKNTFLKHL